MKFKGKFFDLEFRSLGHLLCTPSHLEEDLGEVS